MKKHLTLATIAMLACAGMQAQNGNAPMRDAEEKSFDFTLAYDYFDSFQDPSYRVGSKIYQAFQITSANADLYAGSQITSVNITTGRYQNSDRNTVKNVTLFLTEDLREEPFYTQSGKLGEEAATVNKIELTTPYTITAGKTVYIGYYFTLSSQDMNYLSVDGVYHEDMAGGWIGNKLGNGEIVWNNISRVYGNICMGCTITGDNFATDGVTLLQTDGVEFSEPGKPFSYTIYFQNVASNDVNSLEVAYSVGDGTVKSAEVSLSTPLGYNQRRGLVYNDLVSEKAGVDIPVVFEITKVNGQPNTAADSRRLSYLNCFRKADGFKRMHLMEEGTGTWCQWCPSGIVMMEHIAATYPDDYALAAVHYNDPMAVGSTTPVTNLFNGSYPTAIVDRATRMYPQNSSINQQLRQYTDYYAAIPSLIGFSSISGTKTPDNELKVSTGVKFALDLATSGRYRLSYYLTESGVGPYEQNNGAYAGGANGPMGGWENKSLTVSTLFDDVAVLLDGGLMGNEGSIPATVEVGREYTYETTLPLSTVTKDKVTLIAFVIDNADGTVVNATTKEIDLTNSGVSSAMAEDGCRIIAGEGTLAVEGSFAEAAVYSVAGNKVARLKAGESVSLTSGIYVVVVDGSARKVLVK